MQYKNEKEKSNISTFETFKKYTDRDFSAFCYRFWYGEHPELTYQEIDEQKAEIAKEQKRRSTERWKKRVPCLLCSLLACVFAVFFRSKLLIACLFGLAASILLIVACLTKCDPIEDDEE